jgi:hypothetical protein
LPFLKPQRKKFYDIGTWSSKSSVSISMMTGNSSAVLATATAATLTDDSASDLSTTRLKRRAWKVVRATAATGDLPSRLTLEATRLRQNDVTDMRHGVANGDAPPRFVAPTSASTSRMNS